MRYRLCTPLLVRSRFCIVRELLYLPEVPSISVIVFTIPNGDEKRYKYLSRVLGSSKRLCGANENSRHVLWRGSLASTMSHACCLPCPVPRFRNSGCPCPVYFRLRHFVALGFTPARLTRSHCYHLFSCARTPATTKIRGTKSVTCGFSTSTPTRFCKPCCMRATEWGASVWSGGASGDGSWTSSSNAAGG